MIEVLPFLFIARCDALTMAAHARMRCELSHSVVVGGEIRANDVRAMNSRQCDGYQMGFLRFAMICPALHAWLRRIAARSGSSAAD
jgi:hypothetical protein